MKKKTKKVLALLLAASMTFSLSACGTKTTGNDSPTPTKAGSTSNSENAPEASKYADFLTVDVFASEANYEGIMTGWFANLVKEKFNMELNIISPNVSGGGDTLFTTRSAAGNLGDIVIIGSQNGRLQDCVTAGLLYDMTDLVAGSQTVSQYTEAIEKVKGLVSDGKLYGIPKQVSSQSGMQPSETSDLGYGAFIRWDYYLEAGAPKLNTLEDVIPLMKTIQEKHPTSDSGSAAYAFSLFGDWDGNMMNLAQQPARMYGYNETGFVLHKVDGSDYDSIIDNDSIYVRGLKFFYEANKQKILDPESTTQNWDTLWNKYVDGAVHFSPWSWLGPSAYNTTEHVAEGKGVKYVPIADTQIVSAGAQPSGIQTIISIGSKAQDPQRMFDFIEWLYSPEGIYSNCSPDAGAAGPQGLTWDLVDGKPQLTEFGKKVFSDPSGTDMPAEWGGGKWRDGTSALNFGGVLDKDIDPATGETYSYTTWPSYLEDHKTALDESWQQQYGVTNMLELVMKDGNYIVEPGTNYVAPEESSDITALRNQIKEKVCDYSWRMCFATSDEEFNSLLTEMQETVKGLGYDQVLEYDMQCAKDKDAARAEVRNAAK